MGVFKAQNRVCQLQASATGGVLRTFLAQMRGDAVSGLARISTNSLHPMANNGAVANDDNVRELTLMSFLE